MARSGPICSCQMTIAWKSALSVDTHLNIHQRASRQSIALLQVCYTLCYSFVTHFVTGLLHAVLQVCYTLDYRFVTYFVTGLLHTVLQVCYTLCHRVVTHCLYIQCKFIYLNLDTFYTH